MGERLEDNAGLGFRCEFQVSVRGALEVVWCVGGVGGRLLGDCYEERLLR